MYIGPWQEFKLAQAIKLKNELYETKLRPKTKLSQEELNNHNKRVPPAVKPGASDTASIASGHSRATFNVDTYYDQWVKLERMITKSEQGDTIRKPPVPKQSIRKRNSLNAQRQRINKMRNMYGLNKQLPPIPPKRNDTEQSSNNRENEGEETKAISNNRENEGEETKAIALGNKDFKKKTHPFRFKEMVEQARKIDHEEDNERKQMNFQADSERTELEHHKRHGITQAEYYRKYVEIHRDQNTEFTKKSFIKTAEDRNLRPNDIRETTLQPKDIRETTQNRYFTSQEEDKNKDVKESDDKEYLKEIAHRETFRKTAQDNKPQNNMQNSFPREKSHIQQTSLNSNTKNDCKEEVKEECLKKEEIVEDFGGIQAEESIQEEIDHVDGLLQWVEELPEELSASSTDFYVKNIVL